MSEEGPDFGALKKGDAAAWNMAFAHFWPMALRAGNHPQVFLVSWEREEVAHDAMLDWIDHFDRVATLEEAKALLITIAYRRAISVARRKFAAKRQPAEDVTTDSATPCLPAIEPFCDIERSEITLLLKQALDALDADTRLLLMDKIERELTYEE